MSEETTPKLRLKPKLTADPATAQPSVAADSTPATPPPAASADPAAPATEVPLVRLKPRLFAAPVQQPEATSAPAPEPAAAEPAPVPAPAIAAEPAPTAADAKPAVKFSLRPKAAPGTSAAAAPASFPPPPRAASAPPMPPPAPAADTPPQVLDAPPPAEGAETDHGENGEPAEITAMHAASGTPFPPKYPTPEELMRNLEAAEKTVNFPKPPVAARPKQSAFGPKKKLLLIGGGAGALIVLAAAAFFLTRPKVLPPPPPRPKPVVKPVVEKPKEPEPAVITKPAEPVVEAPAAPAAPVAPPKIVVPQPSVAFRTWVEGLKIMGVRAGAVPRVFIGGTAYAPGDLVNPQLGLSFEGYNPETRMLTFKDKAGAKVERRN